MIKVCVISPLPPPSGGIAQWTSNVINSAHINTDVEIIHIDSSQARNNVLSASVLAKIFRGFGVVFRVIPHYFRSLLSGIDVTHLTTSGYIGTVRDLAVIFVSKLFLKPVVYHIHFGRLPDLSARCGWEWLLLRTCISLSSHVVVLDTHTLGCVRKSFANKGVSLIPNPIDIPAITAEADISPNGYQSLLSSRYVLYLGWLLPTKGIGELIRAWSQISNEGVQLVLAGPCLDVYKKELLSLVGDQSVLFLGEVSHPDAMVLLRGAMFLVLPSHTEAFPNVLLEAMALSRAVLATEVGAIPDILADNCGVIVPPKNVDDLAVALQKLIIDEAFCHELGANGKRKCVALYDAIVVVRAYVALWKSVSSS